MRGIILAGGNGTRLYPATLGVSKQLLAIYDKPMVYYSLSVLMLGQIRDVLLISSPSQLPVFQSLLGDGGRLGMSICYREQTEPRGLPEAFVIGEQFINGDPVSLILGDNLFYGAGFGSSVAEHLDSVLGCKIFGYSVDNPEDYGVVRYDEHGVIQEIIEKPLDPPSKIAVTGLYCYDESVVSRSKELKLSCRGELEISELNNSYLKDGMLELVELPRGLTWMDTGSHDALLEASQFVCAVEKRQGLKIACVEEIAFRNGWIDAGQVWQTANKLQNSSYGRYLKDLIS